MPTKGSNVLNSSNNGDDDSLESSLVSSPVPSPINSPEIKPTARPNISGLLLEDLDLLPTKEESQLSVDLGSGMYTIQDSR